MAFDLRSIIHRLCQHHLLKRINIHHDYHASCQHYPATSCYMPSAPPTVHTHLKQEVVCIVYCNDKIFQHPSLITNGGQQALPVDKEPHLQQLFQEVAG